MTNVVTLGPKKSPAVLGAPMDHRLKEHVTAELRWNNGVLEQMWMVFDWSGTPSDGSSGEIPHSKEWRVVPSSGSAA